jgi:hypothetical protein
MVDAALSLHGLLDFDRIHGAWWDRVVPTDAKAVVARSAERYLKAIGS